jgi:hypothetical protein
MADLGGAGFHLFERQHGELAGDGEYRDAAQVGEERDYVGSHGGYGETEVDVTDPVTGETDEETQKNTDFIRGFGQYNRLFTERLYGYSGPTRCMMTLRT